MTLRGTKLKDLLVAETARRDDARGSFSRLFCAVELDTVLGDRKILQINQSLTIKPGSIRGLHFQHSPAQEMKFVRCLRGRVWDVAVDLRKESPTFLKWHAEMLTPENHLMMIIPEGFAHGFQVIDEGSELLYLHTAVYTPSAEGGLRYNDPLLEIQWPLPVSDLSPRDESHPLIDSNFQGIQL